MSFFFFGLVFGVQIGVRVMDVYYILVFPSFPDELFPWKARVSVSPVNKLLLSCLTLFQF